MAILWGIARENGGLRTSGSTAQSPSHSLSPPSDGFATTPARGRRLPVRASVILKYNGRTGEFARRNLFQKKNLGRSATEAQLGLADEFEFEFDLKFDDRVRIRVSSSGFWVIVSVSSLEYPFGDPFSVPFRVHLGTHFRSLWGPIFGSIWGPIWGPKKTTWRS